MDFALEKQFYESLPKAISDRLGYGSSSGNLYRGPRHSEPWQCVIHTLVLEKRL